MRIIGRTTDGYSRLTGAVVELSESELARVVTGHVNGRVSSLATGQQIRLNERFDHAQDVIMKAHEAIKLPGVLRALADTLEIAVPQIEEITRKDGE